jgi:HD-GYP domain-containing protein (c-di-GMP phosphodiesterase class II)
LNMVKVDLVNFLLSASRGLDFTYTGLLHHHMRVAYLAQIIGAQVGLNDQELMQLFKTAIVHDAGAVTWKEKNILLRFEIENETRYEHCLRGFRFADGVQAFGTAADDILLHHDRWSGGNPSGLEKSRIPLRSRIIHLVDRVDVLIQPGIPILQQRDQIMREIQSQAGEEFDPDLVDLLYRIMQRDSIWLDLVAPWLQGRLEGLLPHKNSREEVTLVDLAQVFAWVVDAKSSFTYGHSQGVAMCAAILGQELGFNGDKCHLLTVAGLLHDLGKVAVPEDILEKKGKLTKAEFNLIKQHTYYTYWLLKPVLEDSPVAEWAAFHHERLNGSGYPFQKQATELSLGSRIVAVADLCTALREERPYRPQMTWPDINKVLQQQVVGGALDKKVVEIVLSNCRQLDEVWESVSQTTRDLAGLQLLGRR